MPMYEYRCEKCEKVQEMLQKFSDAPLTDCELCGTQGSLSKLISKSSFALKGTGWYTTDYKKSSAPAAAVPAVPAASGASASVPAAVATSGSSSGSQAPSVAANSTVASSSPSRAPTVVSSQGKKGSAP